MKKPYMRTIIGSSGRDCVFIMLFPLYGSKTGLIQDNLFRVGQYDSPPPPTFILEDKLIQYQYKLIQFFSNLSKVIPSQKAAGITAQIYRETWWVSWKFFGKNATYDHIKSD